MQYNKLYVCLRFEISYFGTQKRKWFSLKFKYRIVFLDVFYLFNWKVSTRNIKFPSTLTIIVIICVTWYFLFRIRLKSSCSSKMHNESMRTYFCIVCHVTAVTKIRLPLTWHVFEALLGCSFSCWHWKKQVKSLSSNGKWI